MLEFSAPQSLQPFFESHARDFITFFHSQGVHFSIACETSLIHFDPPLTQELKDKIGKIGFFILSGYSFDSLEVFKDYFIFEAGLILEEGKDIGTILKIPYIGVVQILIQDQNTHQPTPIFFNPFEPIEAKRHEESMRAILSKNASLLKDQK
ncbi:hypothetical protein [Helicobacter pametensis]|uniref:hypothetical protein n=1 Tax=Helicobacter pametensis TaxID=95149 RepID=UPI0004AFFFC0|nr:hypothetical protein [Helicobacter pametensis]